MTTQHQLDMLVVTISRAGQSAREDLPTFDATSFLFGVAFAAGISGHQHPLIASMLPAIDIIRHATGQRVNADPDDPYHTRTIEAGKRVFDDILNEDFDWSEKQDEAAGS